MRLLETDKDTVCALATAHGIGAISVIRISGARAIEITRKIATFLPEQLESHKIYYGILRSVTSAAALDEVLVSYFQQGRSFTGEATFEISCHGGEVLASEILRELVAAGCRPAQRGEFTYRAFMNGRIDLVQAESVLALIESRSSRAASLALRQLQGGLSNELNQLAQDLTWVLAHLEANIDFASEDIEIVSAAQLAKRTEGVRLRVERLLQTYSRGRLIQTGFNVALVGAPNAGKSSLLNAISGEETAIVSPVAGTTRDFVKCEWSAEGLRLTAIDTAGLRLTEDPIESIGVSRTLEKMKSVELVLLVVDGEQPSDAAFFDQIPWAKTAAVINKADRPQHADVRALSEKALAVFSISCKTGVGLPEVFQWVTQQAARATVEEDSTLVSNARHFKGLQTLAASLGEAIPLMLKEESPDLIALELQSGLRALYEVLGLTFDDQVMDRVFAEFCLGK